MDRISTYDEYRERLGERGDVFVFRGQPHSDFILIPSGLRKEHRDTADSQMFRFVDEMRKQFDFDELTCIEMAQHFALPTRMLDFSYSYDVALFFACFDSRGRYQENDGKVFIFNKSRYERLLRDRNYLSSQVIRNNRYLYEWLQKYIDKVPTVADDQGFDMPILIDATQQFDRLYMQKGLFLLWGRDECSFETILANENVDFSWLIDTVVIDSRSKRGILEQLAERNISEDTLYMNIARVRELVSDIKYGGARRTKA